MSVSRLSLEQILALANLKMRAGLVDEGIAAFKQAVALSPRIAQTHLSLGEAFHSCNQLNEAIACYRRAIELQPDLLEACVHLGVALREQNRIDEAIHILKHALHYVPTQHEILNDLGILLQMQNRHDEAIAAHRRVVQLQPRWAVGWLNLGNALFKRGNLDEAIAALRQTVLLEPRFEQACANLANMLRAAGLLDQAMVACASALALHPHSAATQNVRGNILLAGRDIAGAIAAFRESIEAEPDNASAHYNLGMTLLLNGEFQQGWRECEWRAQPSISVSMPQWNGIDNIRGKTLLLHAEQGIGDTIQFVRYLPKLVALGAKVILQTAPELVDLLRRDPTIHAISSKDEPSECDLHFPLLSLPMAFGTTLESIPLPLNLRADPDKSLQWKKELGNTRLNVGLAWAGNPTHLNDRNRSIPLSMLEPLVEMDTVQFVSLQKGQHLGTASVIHRIAQVESFADTADLVAALDLVISVDTAVAHLAASMGKPVWLLLPFVPDWRWMLDRTDSPWYPSMKLFRQKKRRGDWTHPIEEVRQSLKTFKTD